MYKLITLLLSVCLVSSCTKDDSCAGAVPLSPVSIKFNIVDDGGNDLIFGEAPEYPYRKLKFYNLKGERLSDEVLYRSISNTGDTSLAMKQDTVVIAFPGGGGEDTIQFFEIGRIQVGCFNYQKYTVYYNSDIVFQDIYTKENDPKQIVK